MLGEPPLGAAATLIGDVIRSSDLDGGRPHRHVAARCTRALLALRDFLYARVYENPVVHEEFKKAQRILGTCYPGAWRTRSGCAPASGWRPGPGEDLARAVTDFLSGMTDRFALETWEKVFVPRPWAIV